MPQRRRRPTRKDVQREETRRKLIDAARRLFEEHGYSGVSTTEIAREVGVTHGAINAHFHSKAGLLFAIIEESNDAQIAEARAAAERSGPPLERLRAVIRIFVRDYLDNPELLGVMQAFSWEWPYDFEARNQAQLAEALAPIRTILDDLDLRPDVDRDRLVRTLFAAYTHGLRAVIFTDDGVDEIVDEVMARIELILDGARSRA